MSTKRQNLILSLLLVILLLAAFAPAMGKEMKDWLIVKKLTVQEGGAVFQSDVNMADSNLVIAAPTDIGTATPGLVVDCAGVSNCIEIRDGATPVFSVANGGGVTMSGSLSPSGGQSVSPNLVVAAPTSLATTTPVLIVNGAGNVGNLVEVRRNSTPQFVIGPAGAVTVNQAVTENGGSTNNVWSRVAAPTAIATATPAAVVDSAGVSNLLEVRKNATPVFTVGNAGAVTGQVLQNASGQKITCGSSTITASATVVHGLSTPVAVYCTLAADPTGNQTCTYTNSSGVVTIKLWQSPAGTPTANGAATSTGWCVVGTP